MSLEKPRIFKTPFGGDADPTTINTIPDVPNPNDIAQKPSLAAYSTGFPRRSMIPPQAGGQPFYGQDVNGILRDITANTQYVQAGNFYVFNAEFQKEIGGYNKYAVVLNPADGKLYQSLIDNNKSEFPISPNWGFFTDGKFLPLQGGGKVNGEVITNGLKSLAYVSSENDQNSDLRLLRATGARDGYFIRRFADDLYIYKAENTVATDKIAQYTKSTDTWDFNTAGLTKNLISLVIESQFNVTKEEVTEGVQYTITFPMGLTVKFGSQDGISGGSYINFKTPFSNNLLGSIVCDGNGDTATGVYRDSDKSRLHIAIASTSANINFLAFGY